MTIHTIGLRLVIDCIYQEVSPRSRGLTSRTSWQDIRTQWSEWRSHTGKNWWNRTWRKEMRWMKLSIIKFNHKHCPVLYCKQLSCGANLIQGNKYSFLRNLLWSWRDVRDYVQQWIYALQWDGIEYNRNKMSRMKWVTMELNRIDRNRMIWNGIKQTSIEYVRIH